MSVRVALFSQVRKGWRPSPEGCLTAAPLQAADVTEVAHTGRKRVRIWMQDRRTKCKTWICGTPENPADGAVFANIPVGWEKCRLCGWALGLAAGIGIASPIVAAPLSCILKIWGLRAGMSNRCAAFRRNWSEIEMSVMKVEVKSFLRKLDWRGQIVSCHRTTLGFAVGVIELTNFLLSDDARRRRR